MNVPALMKTLNTYYYKHNIYLGHYPRDYWEIKPVRTLSVRSFG